MFKNFKVLGLLAGIFAIYLGVLYWDLKRSFSAPVGFVPTRIFSDVTPIRPPAQRTEIVDRLKALQYSIKVSGDEIQFTLHKPDYPDHLLPESHPQLAATHDREEGVPVVLQFDGTSPNASLSSIQLDGSEVRDIYLEPEIIATLSKGGDSADLKIRKILQLDDVPPPLWKAIIAVEDPRFLEHFGLDPRGLARALWVDIRTASLAQGGSTITLQLIKNLTERRGRNILRKINELFLAVLLEIGYTKEEILERYLNEVYLGQVGNLQIHGVGEGARHFFGKSIEELNLAESAFLAGVIRGPAYYSPYSHRERANERMLFVLKRMVDAGVITEQESKRASQTVIRFAPPQNIVNKAPYFTDFVKAELIRHLNGKLSAEQVPDASLRVYSTLDVRLAQIAARSVNKGVEELETRLGISSAPDSPYRLEGALASVDHNTGFVKALIGGRSYARSNFNRILNMKRQVGSTFKPLVYLTSLVKNKSPHGAPYSPGYPMEDAPWTLKYDRGRQTWTPRNYEKEYRGWISLREALAHSVNTIAAKLGVEVGIPNVIQVAKDLGVESPLPEVPSLSLGVAELSPVELLKVYAVLANHGVQDELTVIRAITEENGASYARFVYHPKQVLDRGPVDLLTHMLESVFTDGTARSASQMGLTRPAAGKTGTTSNYRDAWFAGYTPQLTTVVWVGFDQAMPTPEELKALQAKDPRKKRAKKIELTGAASALPIWVRFMREGLESEPPTPFDTASLSDLAIDRRTGNRAAPQCPLEQTINEKFAPGLEPVEESCVPSFRVSESLTEISE